MGGRGTALGDSGDNKPSGEYVGLSSWLTEV